MAQTGSVGYRFAGPLVASSRLKTQYVFKISMVLTASESEICFENQEHLSIFFLPPLAVRKKSQWAKILMMYSDELDLLA